MYEDVIELLRTCRGVIRTHKGLTVLEYAVLVHEIDKKIEYLESMETPEPRQDAKTPAAKAMAS